MTTPLEDIPEYEKFRKLIKYFDKIISNIAKISNIPSLSSDSARFKRRLIIKDSIDIMLLNNKLLKPIFKQRNSQITSLYGINKDLTNLFTFELSADIFVFTSKETDVYKPIKKNNIISYLLYLIILEIDESNVMYMLGDKKLCNFVIFKKHAFSIFDNLNLIINKSGDIAPIKNYMVLCYILYILSCMITKYSMWRYEYKKDTSKQLSKFNPLVQKIVIYTTLDILNSILENSKDTSADKNHIYEIISSKFFLKLNSMFNNQSILLRYLYKFFSFFNGRREWFFHQTMDPLFQNILGNLEMKWGGNCDCDCVTRFCQRFNRWENRNLKCFTDSSCLNGIGIKNTLE